MQCSFYTMEQEIETKCSRIQIGIVGLGAMGLRHVQTFQSLTYPVELSGFDLNHQITESAHATFKIKMAPSFEELLLKNQVVIVATPTHQHVSIAHQALQKKCHVLVEKPLAQTSLEASLLTTVANHHTRLLAVGFVERFNPVIEWIRQHIGRQDIIHIQIVRSGPKVISKAMQNRADIFFDLAIHDLDLCMHLMQQDFEKIWVESKYNELVREEANIDIQFKNSVEAHIFTSWRTNSRVRQWTIVTQQWIYKADLLTGTIQVFEPNTIDRVCDRIEVSNETPLAKQACALFRALTNHELRCYPLATGEESYLLLKALERAMEFKSNRSTDILMTGNIL